MKLVLGCMVFLILSFQTLDIAVVRKSYKIAAHDKTQLESFLNLMTNITKDDNVSLVAYKGASLTLQAKYAKTIKEKKEGFINGVEFIEFAIKKEPNAIEPRFVRLGIQENAPKILRYRSNIEEDKTFLLKQFQHISSKNLKEHIKDYMLQSELFTEQEKSTL